jgi:hypothetical protein
MQRATQSTLTTQPSPHRNVNTTHLIPSRSAHNHAASFRDSSFRGAFFGADAGAVLLFVASFFGFLFSGSPLPPAAGLFSLFSPDDVRLG